MSVHNQGYPSNPGPSIQQGAEGPVPVHMATNPSNGYTTTPQVFYDPRLHDANQLGAANLPAASPPGSSFLGLNFRDDQFWKGALLGAGVTLLLTNETIQKAIVKGTARIYGAVQGGVQEIKEKFEDVQAEMSQETPKK